MSKRSFREYRVLFTFIFFALSVIYYRYEGITEQDEVLEDVRIIAEGQAETSSLVYLETRNEHVNLHVKIDGISLEQSDFKLVRKKYIELTKSYVCSSDVLNKYLYQGKPIIVDLLSTDYASGQFANIRITKKTCV
ncbi:hypothetical protein [Litorilituus lipolyticus]|uniref:Uncharacterized protein n=1 Tax=Litorilituus lipolyticus TaxID=2491017 RepID=A0A502KRJ8_9GAMM|nr:hypothetical protein [Litorilituus lipolyticus]TPH14212.1 hypothetical protein EPA86_11835 [Litorilituus lipolyticus]